MKKIYLLTSSYPYGSGEQFLEHEIPCWDEKLLKIFPLIKKEGMRSTREVEVVDDLAVGEGGAKLRLQDLVNLMRDRFFWKEVLHFKPGFNGLAWRSLLIDAVLSNRLAKSIIKNKEIFDASVVVYCYWSNWILRGAVLAKCLNPSFGYKVVARSHRVDLYAYARPGGYFPFRHMYHSLVDQYFPVSQDGAEYLIKEYCVPREKVSVARLGVPDKKSQFFSFDRGCTRLKLVSVSYVKEVKRLDRIVDALAMLSKTDLGDALEWVHIGDGPLRADIEARAKARGVSCEWKGMLSNSEVMSYLSEHADSAIFINVSDSEGVPVSIMEALSFGIPVVATDVGGSSEILDDRNGIVVSKPFDIEDIVQAIKNLVENRPTKEEIRKTFHEQCSVDNYRHFAERVVGLI